VGRPSFYDDGQFPFERVKRLSYSEMRGKHLSTGRVIGQLKGDLRVPCQESS
jgi:hypothetical protein